MLERILERSQEADAVSFYYCCCRGYIECRVFLYFSHRNIPTNHRVTTLFRYMFDDKRKVTSIIYLSSLGTSITVCFVPMPAGAKIGILVLLLLVQMCASLWYTLSYIPYGRATAQRMLRSVLAMDGEWISIVQFNIFVERFGGNSNLFYQQCGATIGEELEVERWSIYNKLFNRCYLESSFFQRTQQQ